LLWRRIDDDREHRLRAAPQTALIARRRRRQVHDIRRRRPKVTPRRRRRRQHADEARRLAGERQRHVVVDAHAPAGRRTVARRKPAQSPPRIEHVKAIGVALDIGPVRIRRVLQQSMAPEQRLAARADHRPDARRVGAVRIDLYVFAVRRQIILLDRVSVGVFRSDIADRPRRRAAAHHGRSHLRLRRGEKT
jgi:hypothetical protein